MADLAHRFSKLLEQARVDENILAFWLDGSRGKERATAHSDYDCTMIVTDAVSDAYQTRLAFSGASGIDLTVMTLDQFRAEAAWGSSDTWKRYNFAHLTPLVDKTGSIPALFEDKARVPPADVEPFVRAAIDHAVNQIYRALKCLRDGDRAAARLEAAEITAPLLDALFALHSGRLRPYYKYLAWELTAHPLEHCPWTAEALVSLLLEFASDPDPSRLSACAKAFEGLCRGLEFGEVFDAWGDTLPSILGANP